MEKSFEIRVLSGVHGGARATLSEGRTVIGSADDCDIVLSADDVLAHHAAVTVGENGLSITPLEGEVSRADGSLITDEEPLSPNTLFGLGASIMAVGEAGAPWPHLDVSQFGRAQQATPADDATDTATTDSSPPGNRDAGNRQCPRVTKERECHTGHT